MEAQKNILLKKKNYPGKKMVEKILITGANGYVGSSLSNELNKFKDYKLILTDISPQKKLFAKEN